MDHDGIAVILIPFKSVLFCIDSSQLQEDPKSSQLRLRTFQVVPLSPQAGMAHACDSSVDWSYVMSDVQLVQLFFTEEDAPLKTKMTPSRVGG